MNAHPTGSAFDRFHDFLGAILEVVGGDDVEAGGVDDLLALFDVGAFEADNQRHFEAHFLDRGDDALGDHIAAHDAAEDVDQYAFDVVVGGDDLEGFGDFFLGGTAAHVEEVGRFGTVKLDDVHGSHGKARAVHHAADFTVQSDIVEVVFRGLKLFGVFFGGVAQLGDVGVAVDRVAVKAHLGVEAFEIALVGDNEGVDLEHLHVLFEEQFIERAHQFDALFDLRAGEAEVEGDAATVERLIAGGRIDREAEDFLGRFFGHFFDVHAAFGGAYEGHAAGLTVDQKGEVKLGFDAGAVFDVDAVDLFARRTSLLGHEGAAQHALGFVGGLFDGFGEAHAACFTGAGFFEGAFAAAPGVDLCLDHPKGAVEFTCGCFGFFGAEDDAAIRHRGAVGAKKRLRLILMDVHETVPFCYIRDRYTHRIKACLKRFLWKWGISGEFSRFVITRRNAVITKVKNHENCIFEKNRGREFPRPHVFFRWRISGQRAVDAFAGVHEALHGLHRGVEHLLLFLVELDVDDTLDPASADHGGHAHVHVLDAKITVTMGGAGQDALLVLEVGFGHFDGRGGRRIEGRAGFQ